jgi:bifunctional non-homologous end joining protein LigD
MTAGNSLFQQKIVPMEPQPSKVLQEDPGLFYQVKWDGVRILAFGEGGTVHLQGRSLKNKTVLYPELAVLPELVRGKSFILDGEMIALDGGRPSFFAVMQRERAAPGNLSLIKKVPVFYMLFDLLYLDGKWLLKYPWEKRQEMLLEVLSKNEQILVTPSYENGKILLETVRENKMEGIVAKKGDSPYIPGPRKSTYWLKTKIEQIIEAYVGGISFKGNKPSSLLLGLKIDSAEIETTGKMRYIGSVSSGLKERDLEDWRSWAISNNSTLSPFISFNASSRRGYLWVNPVKKVAVTFSEWTPDLKLRAPRISTADPHEKA